MLPIDTREFHIYAAEGTPHCVAFVVDHRLAKIVEQSPNYPMQFMLGVYEFPGPERSTPYPKEFVIDYFRGYRPLDA